jgi:hypothetical protein
MNILKYVNVDQPCMRHVKPAVNMNITVFRDLTPCSLAYMWKWPYVAFPLLLIVFDKLFATCECLTHRGNGACVHILATCPLLTDCPLQVASESNLHCLVSVIGVLIRPAISFFALHVAETWTLRKVDWKCLESFEVWCWRRMEISWTDRVRNKEVLHGV